VNIVLGIPLELRLAGIFALGLALGGFLNLAVYQWAWNARPVSPWTNAPGLKRRWSDRLPAIGWWFLRREAATHGAGFWLRPLLVELAFAGALAGLYWWDTVAGGWLPGAEPGPAPAGRLMTAGLMWVAHLQFLCHALLLAMMLVASLIDLDEKTIPDLLTVPGTLLGLLLAGTCVWILPVGQAWQTNFGARAILEVEFLTVSAPNAWPAPLLPATSMSLIVALGCWLGWCFAMLPRYWRARRGQSIAAAIFWRRMKREPWTKVVALVALLGSLAIMSAWKNAAAISWAALLTSLVGMAVGGGCIWAVRLIGTLVLRKEAMGFGDVTLMAMIGAFLGWQPCLYVFFIAPFAGLVLGVLQLVLRRGGEIPYGPFLCLATCCVVLCWPMLWEWGLPIFAIGWLVPLMMLICSALLVVLLWLMQLVRKMIGRS
jgi:prepilin signal peptidase PulO-like enzyme (type II secretory pathway)